MKCQGDIYLVKDTRTHFYQFKLILVKYLRQLSIYENFAAQRKRELEMEYIMLLKKHLLDPGKIGLMSWTYAQLLQLWEWQWSPDGKTISIEGKLFLFVFRNQG